MIEPDIEELDISFVFSYKDSDGWQNGGGINVTMNVHKNINTINVIGIYENHSYDIFHIISTEKSIPDLMESEDLIELVRQVKNKEGIVYANALLKQHNEWRRVTTIFP